MCNEQGWMNFLGTNYYLFDTEDPNFSLHIGKQSSGWKFQANFQKHAFEMIFNSKPTYLIFDEYDRTYTLVAFVRQVNAEWVYPIAQTTSEQHYIYEEWS